ncbi:hypothetical protein Godav_028202 [Gossypium davidsonii]|uniref:Uncharacterized protein n=1 Tax=Gossypium davidsonii TaxID=34287 RepID=A0A7J8RYM2_GOSDV|nr:hypothetical protein [Gossypium davidsonii]
MQVGPETHQCVHREVETRDAHIPSSMRGVYHHFGGRVVTIGVADEWAEVGSRWASYETHFWNQGMIRLK